MTPIVAAWVLVVGVHGIANQPLLGFPDLQHCLAARAKFFYLMRAETQHRPAAECVPAQPQQGAR